MNPNSFPTGEQAPSQQDSGDAVEFPSFEEHMQQMEQQKGGEKEKGSLIERAKKAIDNILHRRERVAHNMQELNKPTLKNTPPESASFRDAGIAGVYNKLRENQPLSGSDVMGMVFPGYNPKETEEIFNEIGIGSGSEFDVDLPKTLYESDGSEYTTPLMVSFKNIDGSFTQIGISKEEGKVNLFAGRGRREGADVNYSGPRSPKDAPEVFKVVSFDYAGQTLVNENVER